MASEIRVNTINNRSGLGTITLTDTGAVFSGITTISDLRTSGTSVVAAGTTAAPSISPTGDSNTGIFFPSADTIAIAKGGAEALRIDSSGHIGIANSSPKSWGSNIPTIEIKGTATSGGNSTRSGAIAFESGSGSNGYAVLWGQSGGIEIYTGATDRASATYRAKFDSTGNLAFASGNGIDFSATANSSGTMTSELLSDYEEGTWTPTIAGGSTPGTYQASAAVGWYRKIGSVVTGQFRIDLAGTVTGGGTGSFLIKGLPFTVSSSPTNAAGWGSVAYMYGITISGTYAMFFPAGGSTDLLEVSYDRLGNQYLDSPSIVGANDIVGGGFVYIAA